MHKTLHEIKFLHKFKNLKQFLWRFCYMVFYFSSHEEMNTIHWDHLEQASEIHVVNMPKAFNVLCTMYMY